VKIYTNIAALNTNRAYNRSASGLATTLQRLSSGQRVNSAKDDAAGLAISERFTAQIRGYNVGRRNASDAVAMLQTAEGGLQEVSNMLQRMRELAVQAANTAVIGVSERRSLQQEINQLSAEMTRMAKDANYNGVKILDDGSRYSAGGSTDKEKTVQGLASAWLNESEDMIATYFGMQTPGGATLTIDLDSFTDGVGNILAQVGYPAVANATTLTMQIDMADFTDVEFPGDGGTTAGGLAYDRIIAHEMVHAVTANYVDSTGLPEWFLEGTAEFIHGADERVSGHGGVAATYGLVDLKTAWGSSSEEYAAAYLTVRYIHELAGGYTDGSPTASGIGQVFDLYKSSGNLLTAINTAAGTAYLSLDDVIDDAEANTIGSGAVTEAMLSNDDTGAIGGADAEGMSYRDTTNSGVVPDVDELDLNPTGFNVKFPFSPAREISTGFVTSVMFQLGANAGETLLIGLGSATAEALNVSDIDLVTDPSLAISKLDGAIDVVAFQRARLGAQMNRVESAIRSSETLTENLSSSRSRIVDADYAAETAELTRQMIVSRAGTAMQAQAQATSNLALMLLRGV